MTNESTYLNLAKQFAPRFIFHEDEQFHPSSAEFYLDRVQYCRCDEGALSTPTVFDDAAANMRVGEESRHDYLQFPEGDEAIHSQTARGDLAGAKVYAHIVGVDQDSSGTLVDIRYWLFYPYNGFASVHFVHTLTALGMPRDISLPGFGEHEGDWEHVTVRVLRDAENAWMVGMYFSQHSGGEWLTNHELDLTKDGRPKVYVSRNGHASWPGVGMFPTPGSQFGDDPIEGFLANETSADFDENAIDSRDRLELIGINVDGYAGFTPPRWVDFLGSWGRVLTEEERRRRAIAAIDNVYSPDDPVAKAIKGAIAKKVEGFVGDGPIGPKAKSSWQHEDRSGEITFGWNMLVPQPKGDLHEMDTWLRDIETFFESCRMHPSVTQSAKVAICDQNSDSARAVVFYHLGGDTRQSTSLSGWELIRFLNRGSSSEDFLQNLYQPALQTLRAMPLERALQTRIEMTNALRADAHLYMWVPQSV